MTLGRASRRPREPPSGVGTREGPASLHSLCSQIVRAQGLHACWPSTGASPGQHTVARLRPKSRLVRPGRGTKGRGTQHGGAISIVCPGDPQPGCPVQRGGNSHPYRLSQATPSRAQGEQGTWVHAVAILAGVTMLCMGAWHTQGPVSTPAWGTAPAGPQFTQRVPVCAASSLAPGPGPQQPFCLACPSCVDALSGPPGPGAPEARPAALRAPCPRPHT